MKNKIFFYAFLIFFSISCTNENPKLQLILDAKAILGEGAIWYYEQNQLIWIDIENCFLHIYHPSSKTEKHFPLHSRIGTIVPEKKNLLILALQDGIYRFNITNKKCNLITKPLYSISTMRFNDGKCDPAGRFWVGSMAIKQTPNAASLYVLTKEKIISKVLDSITISNGICWSSDKTKMYYIDSPTRKVKEYNYSNETGIIKYNRIAVSIPDTLGFPDGMTIDSDDNLWIAHWDGYSVCKWNPKTGELLKRIIIPCPHITSCAFGGNDLKTLYITTARIGLKPEELKKYPFSGGVFSIKPGETGVKCNYFRTY